MKEKENTDLILLNIGYAVHRADWNYKNVNSPFARIYLVKEGVAKLHLQDRDHIQLLTPEHLYLIPPFTLHSYKRCRQPLCSTSTRRKYKGPNY